MATRLRIRIRHKFLFALMLALTVAIGGLWIFSYWASGILFRPQMSSCGFANCRGSVIYLSASNLDDFGFGYSLVIPPGTSLSTVPPGAWTGIAAPAVSDKWQWMPLDSWQAGIVKRAAKADSMPRGLGFYFGSRVPVIPGSFGGGESSVIIPIWPAFVIVMLGAAMCVRVRRSYGAGMCAKCGYDLRASPERCPECGTITGEPGVRS